jgi:hypothetical protein
MQQPFFGSDIMLHGSSGGGFAAVPLPLSFAWGGSVAAAQAAVSSGRTPLRSSSHWQYYSRGVTDLGRYELLSDEMRDKYQHHYCTTTGSSRTRIPSSMSSMPHCRRYQLVQTSYWYERARAASWCRSSNTKTSTCTITSTRPGYYKLGYYTVAPTL